MPVSEVRDEIGSLLRERKITLLDSDIDTILVRAPTLLPNYVVTFSPFSGPARGGLQIDAKTYVGFISLRKRTASVLDDAEDEPVGKATRKRKVSAKGQT